MKAVIGKILSLLLYAALYAAVTALVCVTGAIHPVFFVCYQITAGILLSGIVMTAFRRMKGPGIAACMFLGLLFLLIMIQDASAWHVIPLIVITAAAEVIRAMCGYGRNGDVIATIIMTFSTFGYYGQIWFNRAYTYECAVEEMPAGYADALMAVSPAWVLPVVSIAGILLFVLNSNVTVKIFKLEK